MRTLHEDLQEPCGLTYRQLGDLSDEKVMAHLGAGHGDAVAVLLDRYSRLVLSVASQIIHEHAESEDRLGTTTRCASIWRTPRYIT